MSSLTDSSSPSSSSLFKTIHTILTLATFIIYMITIGTFIPVIVLGTLVVFMLAYIPVVSVLDAKNKSSWLQAAGVEVGYLAVQQAGWIGEFVCHLESRYTWAYPLARSTDRYSVYHLGCVESYNHTICNQYSINRNASQSSQ